MCIWIDFKLLNIKKNKRKWEAQSLGQNALTEYAEWKAKGAPMVRLATEETWLPVMSVSSESMKC